MGVLTTAWNVFKDRVLDDSDVQDYFDTIQLTEKSGTFEGNFLKIQIGATSAIPKAVPTLKQITLPIQFEIITDNSDDRIIEEQAMLALETLLNAVEKAQTDATWHASFVKTDWEVENIINIDHNSIQINGLITLLTQPYKMGAL